MIPNTDQLLPSSLRLVYRGKRVGEDAVQLHGGMGVSEEMSIGHYLKRFISIDSQFGNSHFHLKKFNNS